VSLALIPCTPRPPQSTLSPSTTLFRSPGLRPHRPPRRRGRVRLLPGRRTTGRTVDPVERSADGGLPLDVGPGRAAGPDRRAALREPAASPHLRLADE